MMSSCSSVKLWNTSTARAAGLAQSSLSRKRLQRDRTDSFAALFERIDDRSVQQFGLLRIFQVFDFVLNDIGQFVERVHNAGF